MADAPHGPTWTHTRARIAKHHQQHPGTPVPDDLRRDHAAARLETYVRDIVAKAPPLNSDQRARIVAALGPTGAGAGAA